MRATGSDRITEIAVVVVCGGRREVVFESLVNPGRPIPPAICAITNITNDMVREAPPFAEVCRPGARGARRADLRRPQREVRLELRERRAAPGARPRARRPPALHRAAGPPAGAGDPLLRAGRLTHWFGFANAARHRAARRRAGHGGAARPAALRWPGRRGPGRCRTSPPSRPGARPAGRAGGWPCPPSRWPTPSPEDSHDPLAHLSGGRATCHTLEGGTPAPRRRRDVRRGAQAALEQAGPARRAATGSRWPCAAFWSSIPTAWC